jgi:predicted GIY-YIG superfamily endonuclease
MLSGIYIIKNIINDMVYIGSSQSIITRISSHKSMLRHNRHCNKKLQEIYNQCGEKGITFKILKICKINLLLKKEIKYCNKFKHKLLNERTTIYRPYIKKCQRAIYNLIEFIYYI